MAAIADAAARQPAARAGPSAEAAVAAAPGPGAMAARALGGLSAASAGMLPESGSAASQTPALSVGHQHASAAHTARAIA